MRAGPVGAGCLPPTNDRFINLNNTSAADWGKLAVPHSLTNAVRQKPSGLVGNAERPEQLLYYYSRFFMLKRIGIVRLI
jgi:hypothetical protein